MAMTMRKWRSWTGTKWLAVIWRVREVAAKKFTSKSRATLPKVEKKNSIKSGQSSSEQAISCTRTPRTSASLETGYEHVSPDQEPLSQMFQLKAQSDSSLFQKSANSESEQSISSWDGSEEGELPPQNLSALPIRSISDVKKGQRRRKGPDLKSLVDKRMAVLATRMRVEESRNALRNIREDLMDMDARFTQDLRNLLAKSANQQLKILIDQNEGIQKVREEVQLKESEYNLLEDELNRAEWSMNQDENKVYEQLSNAEGHMTVANFGYSSQGDDVDRSSSRSGMSTRSSTSPMKRQRLSRMGDRELLMEQLEELRDQRAYWVEQQTMRIKIGRVLDEEGQHFLRTFDSRQTSLLEDLRQVDEDLARIQASLDAQADVRYTLNQFDGENRNWGPPPDPPDDPELASKDPLFLDSYKEIEDKLDGLRPTTPIFANVAVDANGESLSTVGFINAWLLHILRRSAIEVRRFKTAKELQPLGLDRDRLAQLVLEWWSKDATVNLFPSARNYSARSVSVTSKAINQDQTTRARSDTVVFTVHRIARRLQSSQHPRAERDAGKTTFDGINISRHSRHATTPTV